ncbi:right-handed parallel beta-helix repeat-containing protein [Myxococcus stipitatus]|uniref:right-handed parallel beta-helix repeat-containing protein n=1 Tax=Myxococcus stipitatus TaxID=83455 RepID=UPI001F4673CB|nr:right-handed parallel beta-helix repeat-containing protein [Myxococcus stipitatus]MCE9669551.1 right-handed parallel beta-helix repeat-containing protein [Myxococcus stipitatus]
MLPAVALATNVPGGVLASDTTWTPAGNPWTLQGTLTIPEGVTLTLEPGVSVVTADSTVYVEVYGSLVAVGTSASPISIQLQASGLYVRGSVVADHLTVVGGKPAIRVVGSGSATFNHSRMTSGAPSFSISGEGSLDFENGVFNDCQQVMSTTGGTSTLRSSVIHGCTPTSTAALISIVNQLPKVTLVHNTFFDNRGSAIDGSMTGPTNVSITLHDNIIVGSGSYGVRLTNVLAPVIHHNVVWGFTNANYVGVSPGEGSVNANPLLQGFASLSENSPARNAASDGTDLGALPYAGHPAHPLLEGILRSDRTLTGDNIVTGDLLVSAGVSLTLAPGASLTVKHLKAAPGGGLSVPVKVIIAGTLRVEGTVDAPVTFQREYSAEVAELQGEASFKHAAVKGALVIRGTATFQDSTLSAPTSVYWVKGTGSATFKDSTVTGAISITTEDDSSATVENVTLSGVRLEARGNSTLTAKNVTATNGGVSTYDSATATVTGSTFKEGYTCLRVAGGSLTFERGTLQRCTNAVEATGGVVKVSYSLVRDSSRSAPALAGGFHIANASASIFHNTIINNAWGGFYVATQPQNSVEIRDNIIKSNQYTGIEVVAASNISIHHNAVWDHTSNYKGNPTLGPGSLTEDPLFVSPRHLTVLETSPCRNAASDGTDMGAFPYVPIPAASLVLDRDSITAPGKARNSITARVFDAEGLELPHAVVTWSVPAEVGTIDSSGTLTLGCALGSFPGAVVAKTGALSASVDVTVTLGAIQSLTLTPSQLTLRIGETQQFSAKVLEACGHEVPTTFRWATSNAGIGSISDSGFFTANTYVTANVQGVQVEAGGMYAFASVTVQPGPVHSIELTPEHLTLAANSKEVVTAVALDRARNLVTADIDLRVVGGGGTIDAARRFNAGTVAGHFPRTIQASYGGLSATMDVTVTPGPLWRVEVVPDVNEVKTRETLQFKAYGFDLWGNKRDSVPTWAVTNSALGTITSNGLLKVGTAAGFYPGGVKATMEGMSRPVDVTVLPGPLSRLALTPPFATLEPQGTQQFGVMGFDGDGNPRPLSPTWSVVTPGAGSITSEGLFTAPRVAGTYTNSVSVTVDHLTLNATIYVKPAAIRRVEISPVDSSVVVKGTVPFKAKAFDAYDNEVTSFTASWSVVKGGGSITAAGVFTAGTVAGTYADTIQVTVAGVTKTTSVTVTPGAVSRITLSPQGPTVAAGGSVAFSAKAFDAYDNEVTSAPASWKVVNGGGSIDGAGVFTAGIMVGAFSGTVQVTMGGMAEQTSVSVVAAAPSRVVLSPQNPTLPAGGTVTFSAQAFDMYGNEAPAFPATWKVVNGGGTVDASGVFSAGTVGGTFLNTVQVTVGSATGTTSVTVTSTTPNPQPEPGEPSRVVLTPQNPTLPAGGSVTLRVQAFDVQGNETTKYPATWKVVNGGGSIDASGVFTAGSVAGTFSNTIQVTVGSVTGTTSVTVTSTTPNPQPEPECRQSSDCGEGGTCNAGVCVAPPASGGNNEGGGCSSSGSGTSVFGLLVLVMLAVESRKRRTAR